MRTVMMSLLASLLFALPTLQSEAAPRTQATPQVVSYVELNRYTGLWYEIASNPTAFEVGCVGTTAQYTARPDGIIDVENRCYIRRIGGRERIASGAAAVVDTETNAKLNVSFSGTDPSSTGVGNYWILDLDSNYGYAAVGDPSGSYLWILSRTPTLDQSTYDGIISRLNAQGYDTSKLKQTVQE